MEAHETRTRPKGTPHVGAKLRSHDGARADPVTPGRFPGPSLERTERADFHGLIGRSPAMLTVYRLIECLAPSPLSVLILGETGTGKELVARAIHEISGREKPLVVVNCAALPEGLVESELFGHERGAFTSATRKHRGLLAQAHEGILFLDELPALSLEAQAKLLRAVEDGEYRPVGGEKLLRSDFRLIAATNRDLRALASRGEFRPDLYHRIGPAAIVLPPLRERLEDLPALAEAFLHTFRREHESVRPRRITKRALELLTLWDWPGNVRELRNVVERAAVLACGATLGPEEVAPFLQPLSAKPETGGRIQSIGETGRLARAVQRAEREAIVNALREAGGCKELASHRLGINLKTLYRKLATHNGRLQEGPSQNWEEKSVSNPRS